MTGKEIHILYLDDDPATARLIQKHLDRAGYHVEIAHDSDSGFGIFQQSTFDLIALDYRMPGDDGLEVIRKLATYENTPPIIMVTGSGNENVAVAAMKIGASDYIVKDVEGGFLDLLPTVIEQVLQKQLLLRERQNALDALQRRNHDLALLHRVSQLVTATLDFEQVIEQLLRVAAELVNAESGAVWLCEAHEKTTRLKCQALLNQAQIQTPPDLYLSIGEGDAGWVVKHGEAILIDDIRKDQRFSSQVRAFPSLEIKNMIGTPIQIRDVTKGALIVLNKTSACFDENDLFLIQTLASTASIAIENARLFEDVRRLSITDDLTGVYSRRHFYSFAEKELQRAIRYEHEFAIIILDIDDFKKVNDRYGHLVGDKVLKVIASGLKEIVRRVDFVSRYGGEEFVILLPETNLPTAIGTAERLRHYIEGIPFKTEDEAFTITISAGVTSYSPDSANIEDLLKQADEALYQAKVTGKNRVVSAKQGT